jgi:hypothetical protein
MDFFTIQTIGVEGLKEAGLVGTVNHFDVLTCFAFDSNDAFDLAPIRLLNLRGFQ